MAIRRVGVAGGRERELRLQYELQRKMQDQRFRNDLIKSLYGGALSTGLGLGAAALKHYKWDLPFQAATKSGFHPDLERVAGERREALKGVGVSDELVGRAPGSRRESVGEKAGIGRRLESFEGVLKGRRRRRGGLGGGVSPGPGMTGADRKAVGVYMDIGSSGDFVWDPMGVDPVTKKRTGRSVGKDRSGERVSAGVGRLTDLQLGYLRKSVGDARAKEIVFERGHAPESVGPAPPVAGRRGAAAPPPAVVKGAAAPAPLPPRAAPGAPAEPGRRTRASVMREFEERRRGIISGDSLAAIAAGRQDELAAKGRKEERETEAHEMVVRRKSADVITAEEVSLKRAVDMTIAATPKVQLRGKGRNVKAYMTYRPNVVAVGQPLWEVVKTYDSSGKVVGEKRVSVPQLRAWTPDYEKEYLANFLYTAGYGSKPKRRTGEFRQQAFGFEFKPSAKSGKSDVIFTATDSQLSPRKMSAWQQDYLPMDMELLGPYNKAVTRMRKAKSEFNRVEELVRRGKMSEGAGEYQAAVKEMNSAVNGEFRRAVTGAVLDRGRARLKQDEALQAPGRWRREMEAVTQRYHAGVRKAQMAAGRVFAVKYLGKYGNDIVPGLGYVRKRELSSLGLTEGRFQMWATGRASEPVAVTAEPVEEIAGGSVPGAQAREAKKQRALARKSELKRFLYQRVRGAAEDAAEAVVGSRADGGLIKDVYDVWVKNPDGQVGEFSDFEYEDLHKYGRAKPPGPARVSPPQPGAPFGGGPGLPPGPRGGAPGAGAGGGGGVVKELYDEVNGQRMSASQKGRVFMERAKQLGWV